MPLFLPVILLDHARGCSCVSPLFRASLLIYARTLVSFTLMYACAWWTCESRWSCLARPQGRLIYHMLKDWLPSGARWTSWAEKIFSLEGKRDEKEESPSCGNRDRLHTRVHATLVSTYLVSFDQAGSAELLRRKWYQRRLYSQGERGTDKKFRCYAYSCKKRKLQLQKPTWWVLYRANIMFILYTFEIEILI